MWIALIPLTLVLQASARPQDYGYGSTGGAASSSVTSGFTNYGFDSGYENAGSSDGGAQSGMRLEDAIPGIPAVDYPIFPFVPPTQFSCNGRLPGYYADPETGCQAFHICYDDRMASFLCPNGTTFHQQFFVCDWWFNSDCSQAESFYSVNANLFVTNGQSSWSPSEFQTTQGLPVPLTAEYPTSVGGGQASYGSTTAARPQAPLRQPVQTATFAPLKPQATSQYVNNYSENNGISPSNQGQSNIRQQNVQQQNLEQVQINQQTIQASRPVQQNPNGQQQVQQNFQTNQQTIQGNRPVQQNSYGQQQAQQQNVQTKPLQNVKPRPQNNPTSVNQVRQQNTIPKGNVQTYFNNQQQNFGNSLSNQQPNSANSVNTQQQNAGSRYNSQPQNFANALNNQQQNIGSNFNNQAQNYGSGFNNQQESFADFNNFNNQPNNFGNNFSAQQQNQQVSSAQSGSRYRKTAQPQEQSQKSYYDQTTEIVDTFNQENAIENIIENQIGDIDEQPETPENLSVLETDQEDSLAGLPIEITVEQISTQPLLQQGNPFLGNEQENVFGEVSDNFIEQEETADAMLDEAALVTTETQLIVTAFTTPAPTTTTTLAPSLKLSILPLAQKPNPIPQADSKGVAKQPLIKNVNQTKPGQVGQANTNVLQVNTQQQPVQTTNQQQSLLQANIQPQFKLVQLGQQQAVQQQLQQANTQPQFQMNQFSQQQAVQQQAAAQKPQLRPVNNQQPPVVQQSKATFRPSQQLSYNTPQTVIQKPALQSFSNQYVQGLPVPAARPSPITQPQPKPLVTYPPAPGFAQSSQPKYPATPQVQRVQQSQAKAPAQYSNTPIQVQQAPRPAAQAVPVHRSPAAAQWPPQYAVPTRPSAYARAQQLPIALKSQPQKQHPASQKPPVQPIQKQQANLSAYRPPVQPQTSYSKIQPKVADVRQVAAPANMNGRPKQTQQPGSAQLAQGTTLQYFSGTGANNFGQRTKPPQSLQTSQRSNPAPVTNDGRIFIRKTLQTRETLQPETEYDVKSMQDEEMEQFQVAQEVVYESAHQEVAEQNLYTAVTTFRPISALNILHTYAQLEEPEQNSLPFDTDDNNLDSSVSIQTRILPASTLQRYWKGYQTRR